MPLIVVDPSRDADTTRGTVDERLVSGVDVVPTVLAALGLSAHAHRVEGRSLLAATRGAASDDWRTAVVSELDYAFRQARLVLGRQPGECRAWMVRTARWKYVHWQGLPPQLFDLEKDPDEFDDLGTDAGHDAIRTTMRGHLLDWFSQLKPRTTLDDATVAAKTNTAKAAGVFFGVW